MKWWTNANTATRVRYGYALFAALALVAYVIHAWQAGPIYEGRRIRTWVNMADTDAIARDIVVEIGKPAAPFLLSAVEGAAVDESKFRQWLRRVLPRSLADRIEPPFNYTRSEVWLELLQQVPIDADAFEPLVRILHSSDFQPAAAANLARLPTLAMAQAERDLASADPERVKAGILVASYLPQYGEEVVAHIEKGYASPHAIVRYASVHASYHIGPELDELLLKLLRSTNVNTVQTALGIWDRQSPDRIARAMPEILRTLNHPDRNVRRIAIETVRRLVVLRPELINDIERCFTHPDEEVQRPARRAALQVKAEPARRLQLATRLLQSGNEEWIADALGYMPIDNRPGFNAEEVRLANATGLSAALLDMKPTSTRGECFRLLHLARWAPDSAEAARTITAATRHEDLRVRQAAFHALALLKGSAAERCQTILEATAQADEAILKDSHVRLIVNDSPEMIEVMRQIEASNPRLKAAAKWMLTPQEGDANVDRTFKPAWLRQLLTETGGW